MTEPQTYIRRDAEPFIEAMYLTKSNYKEVCTWMDYDEFKEDGENEVRFFKPGATYHAKYGTWIVQKTQTMSDEKFNDMYVKATRANR
jgi:hypothetical protein